MRRWRAIRMHTANSRPALRSYSMRNAASSPAAVRTSRSSRACASAPLGKTRVDSFDAIAVPATREELFPSTPRRCGEPCPPNRAATSQPTEPVIALVLPIAAGVVIGHLHADDVLGVLEAELGGHADFHREAVLHRQCLVGELERHLRLRVRSEEHT